MHRSPEKASQQLRQDIEELKIVSAQLMEATSRLLEMVQVLDKMMERALEVFERVCETVDVTPPHRKEKPQST